MPVEPGSSTVPVPGYGVACRPGPVHPVGRRRALRLVVPEHLPRNYLTGDGGYLEQDGYLFRSGKILRRSMRAIAEGRDEAVPSTIENPAVLDDLRGVLRG